VDDRGATPRGRIPSWTDGWADVRIAFLGRGPRLSPPDALLLLEESPRRAAWLRQVHSNRVREARPGLCGTGDVMVSHRSDLALTVFTADCVPVLLAGPSRQAAAHAGWRGIVAGVVDAALDAVAASPERVVAWIGPAIGPCCYEVGNEVADLIEGKAAAPVRSPGSGARPHIDLPGSVAALLRRAGVRDIRNLSTCTSCHPGLLWSYRRDGRSAGRNLAFLWRSAG